MLIYKVNGTLGKRVPLAAPEIPSDITKYIISFKSCRIKTPMPSPGSATIVRFAITFVSLLFFVSGKNIAFIALKKRVSAVKIHDRCNGKKLYLPLNLLNIVLIQ